MVQIQKSFKTEQTGKLYLVPTPIGNLEDMTYRAVSILQSANIIAAEDTRHTKKLCHAFSIKTPLISYHEHNKREREDDLVERAKRGETIALVSDAGMPAISDPGADLVKRFAAENIPVIPLPGANAALTALIASGLSTEAFTFIGFLARKKKDRVQEINKWKHSLSTLILYESPHRLKETLADLVDVLGNRDIAIARELTKQYETIMRGKIADLLEVITEEGTRGEYVVLISGADEEEVKQIEGTQNWWNDLSIIEHVDEYIEKKSIHSKEAIKQTAVDRDLSKREVYQTYHVEKE